MRSRRPGRGQRIHPDDLTSSHKLVDRISPTEQIFLDLIEKAAQAVLAEKKELHPIEQHSRTITPDLPTQAVCLYQKLQNILLDIGVNPTVIESAIVDKLLWELSGLANHQRGSATVVGNSAELTKLLSHLGRVEDNELRQRLIEATSSYKEQKLQARIALKTSILSQVAALLSTFSIFLTPEQSASLEEVLIPYLCLHLNSDTFPKSTIGTKTNHKTLFRALHLLAPENTVLTSQLVAVVSELVSEFNRSYGL